MIPDYGSMSHGMFRYPDVATSQMGSHVTILKPRDIVPSPSDVFSTAASFFSANDNEANWKRRAKFFFRILSFCLGPANIWRFPQQSFIYGNATYMYLYIVYSWIIGVSLLVFEVSLSQYFMKGFAKLFTLCPIMEGITLSMAFYCIIATFLYSMICVYSLVYVFTGFYNKMPHSYCSDPIKMYGCKTNYTNFTHSPEFIFFYNYVERYMDADAHYYNWRNAVLLVFIWLIILIVTWFSILRHHWVVIIHSLSIILVLIYATTVGLIMDSKDGNFTGLSRMFIPTTNDILQIRTWIYPLEQSVVSLGVGAGPLITIWSISKLKYWSPCDTLMINVVTFICTLLSGIIFFSSAGILVGQNKKTLPEKHEELHVHVLYTPLFNMLGKGASNFTVVIYYLVLFCSCLYSLLEYVQILLLYISSYVLIDKRRRKIVIIMTCSFLCICSTLVGDFKWGFAIIMSINKNFIATALLIILTFELLSVSYFYGFRNFCDDIEFMLGFVPNYFFQITWLLLPAVFSVFSAASLYLKFQEIENNHDIIILSLIILFIILPVILIAMIKCIVGIREMGIRRVLNPRRNESDWENDSVQLSPTTSIFAIHQDSLRNYRTEYPSSQNFSISEPENLNFRNKQNKSIQF
ncbi:sodium-dependent noradrenaline transporter-like [Tribolium madens]|uniref:sodium-dependent noradrenaline transporter-like n=1 Tax=Tribolium madens TaxID=41895 RepID=UPI001CF73E1D|nr:sodium-dependent noradrenaline transporter-like [Tribolium madens]